MKLMLAQPSLAFTVMISVLPFVGTQPEFTPGGNLPGFVVKLPCVNACWVAGVHLESNQQAGTLSRLQDGQTLCR